MSEFYDHFVEKKPTGLGRVFNRSCANTVFKFLNLKKGMKVLEIGAGKGELADICIANGMDYTAIEPNTTMVVELEKRGIKVISRLVPPLGVVGKFDAVVSINVFEHLNNQIEVMNLMRDIYKVLNPSGKCLVSVPDFWNQRKFFYDVDFSHSFPCTFYRIRQVFYDIGYKNITGFHHCTFFKGFMSFVVSGIFKHLPFIYLSHCCFRNSKILMRLSEGQYAFLRSAVVAGEV